MHFNCIIFNVISPNVYLKHYRVSCFIVLGFVLKRSCKGAQLLAVISAQQYLITLIETCKKYLDGNESFGALLTDLSKASDCVNHELLIAKLHVYGLDHSSLRLIHSYLNNRQ